MVLTSNPTARRPRPGLLGIRPPVCPRTGLLRRVKVTCRKRRLAQKESSPPYFRVGADLQCRFLDGGWHLVTVKPLPMPDWNRQHCQAQDILLNRPVSGMSVEDAQE